MANEESNGNKVDDIKVQHLDSAQSGIDQLLSQQSQPQQDDSSKVTADHAPSHSVVDTEGIGSASMNSVFMTPSRDGGFQLNKVEFVNTIHADAMIQQSITLQSQE